MLIGDANAERFSWLKELLADAYGVVGIQAKSFDDVKNFAQDKSTKFSPRVVFLTDDLPYSVSLPKKDPKINFIKLEEYFYEADFVCVVTKEDEPDLEGVTKRPHHMHLRSFPPTEADRNRIIIELGGLGSGLRATNDGWDAEKVIQWDRNNRVLQRQIRSLSERRDLKDGLNHLRRLIGKCLDGRRAQKIEIRQLGQGKSGAIVFHLIKYAGQVHEYVIKLTPSDSLWKLEAEVHGHLEAQSKTGLPGYKQHVAKLEEPNKNEPLDPEKPEGRFIVDSGHWYAIHYDFLGGSTFGNFIDLETELTAGPATLMKKTSGSEKFTLASDHPDDVFSHRLNVVSTAIDGLCEIWYGNKELVTRRSEIIWKVEDAPEHRFIPLPPYQLTQRIKGWIHDFLDSREASFGARLFPDWEHHKEGVLRLINNDQRAPKRLGDTAIFTLSPVHGDLNANNVLLWLKYDKYPFLIDLPFYQRDGHALQDFARLEVDITSALLDRQEESPLRELAAYDYCLSQIPLWIEMEDRLLDPQAFDTALVAASGSPQDAQINWKADGYKNNVRLCFALTMILRQKAFAIQQKVLNDAPPAGPFQTEYLPALLYHSVRAIAYPSLSVFKRMLAVYTAGSILKRLNEE